ncbi:MCR_0457 family protein [Acinetobacter bereziniae]|uniref:MCR_0457 family protein n=1 Tax=Acinetobacter bereziniae TaxID=106648 RepID=UPI0019005120|nr:hypothetical protein [Acinetobacter bereziniae]MBJ8450970.1 hypothetical protein [Acinetobacter bereziniae]MBJ8455302.1 hypothetical protein [Acinetobacter bereziniae]
MRMTLKMLTLSLVSASGLFMTHAFAAPKDAASHEQNIEVTQQQVSKEELAAIYVLSDICPSLIKTDAAFDKGFNLLLKDYMPNDKNPKEALKTLAKQKDFQRALKEAKADAKKAGDTENTAICNDISRYGA